MTEKNGNAMTLKTTENTTIQRLRKEEALILKKQRMSKKSIVLKNPSRLCHPKNVAEKKEKRILKKRGRGMKKKMIPSMMIMMHTMLAKTICFLKKFLKKSERNTLHLK